MKAIRVKGAYGLAEALSTVVQHSHQATRFFDLWRETRCASPSLEVFENRVDEALCDMG